MSGTHIFKCSVQNNPKDIPDKKITLSFGTKRNGKVLVSKLKHGDSEVRLNALKAYCDQANMPKFAVSFLSAGVVSALYELVKDESSDIRSLLPYAISQTTKSPGGVSQLVKGGMDSMKPLLHDEIESVRANMYGELETIVKNTLCLNELVANGYIDVLVNRASNETPKFQSAALKILYMLLLCPDKTGLLLAIDAGAVDIAMLHLKSDNIVSVEYATKIIGLLCSEQGPLQKVINSSDGIPTLMSLLSGTNVANIAGSAAALMVILSDDQAKFKYVDANGIQIIIQLIQHTDRAVLLHVLKMISVLAPHPKAKVELNTPIVISRLETMEMDTYDLLVGKCARIAKELILRMP
jgi:hypothetical protein